jgi:uncharacterized protein (TIGR00369 family)
MKKILNPFTKLPGYNCFGCSPENPMGLRMEFVDEDEYIVCSWDPKDAFQGFHNVLHGGVQATLLDEIASWVTMTRLKTGGVTSRMDVRYLKKVPVNEGKLTIRGKLIDFIHHIATVDAEILLHDGSVACKASVQYYMLDEEKARKHLYYPGIDAFYES